jgi:hypothetical protein
VGTYPSIGKADLRETPGGRLAMEADADGGEVGRGGYAIFYGALVLSAALTTAGLIELVSLVRAMVR